MGKTHHLPRGKVLGGSNAINFMAYVRPTAEDIDAWAVDTPEWSWDALEPFYHRSESVQSDANPSGTRSAHYALDPKFHGFKGPVQLSWPPTPPEIDSQIVEAISHFSTPNENQDPYGGHHLGFNQYLSTVDRRNKRITRSYSANAYLEPCLDRHNLHILTGATACRILLRDTNPPQAFGVKFLYAGVEHEVNAECEVILSTSTIQSPRLLELSGIGNPEILHAAGISCVVNLPEVGENLLEHPMSAATYELEETSENITLDTLLANPEVFQTHLQQLLETQDGLLAGSVGLGAFTPYASLVSGERLENTIASIQASRENLTKACRLDQTERSIRLLRSLQAPAIQIVGMPCNFDLTAGYVNQSRLIQGPPAGSSSCYTMLVSAAYAVSRGSTHIPARADDVDPQTAPPQIDVALLAHPADVDILAAGLTAVDRAFRSHHLARRVKRRVLPPAKVDLEQEQQAREYIREYVMMFNHNSGTCALGRVVDSRLRVQGVSGLRIVDCSVIPDQISANTMATVYALAERAAEFIRKDRAL